MGELAGFERPNWYALGDQSNYQHTYGKPNWFDACQRECDLLRHSVALFDQSSYSIFKVQGRQAQECLDYLSANRVDVEDGHVVYSQWLNQSGGIEADVTITRVSSREFMVVGGCASSRRDYYWLTRHARNFDCEVSIENDQKILGVMGPRSRDLLASLSDPSHVIEELSYYRSAILELAGISVRANRLSYVGELGYELLVAENEMGALFDLLRESDQDFEVGLAGYHAMNSCRIEKGYRHWGHDIHDHINPYEAGLSFVVSLEKGEFLGREALLKAKHKNERRLCAISIEGEDAPFMIHDEPIYRNGERVGLTTSAAWGHRVNKSLAIADISHAGGIDNKWIEAGEFEVEVATTRYPVSLQMRPFYDPNQARIKA